MARRGGRRVTPAPPETVAPQRDPFRSTSSFAPHDRNSDEAHQRRRRAGALAVRSVPTRTSPGRLPPWPPSVRTSGTSRAGARRATSTIRIRPSRRRTLQSRPPREPPARLRRLIEPHPVRGVRVEVRQAVLEAEDELPLVPRLAVRRAHRAEREVLSLRVVGHARRPGVAVVGGLREIRDPCRATGRRSRPS